MPASPTCQHILDDHAALRRLPKGSLGQDYCDFMERDGLTAASLVAEFEICRGDRPRLTTGSNGISTGCATPMI